MRTTLAALTSAALIALFCSLGPAMAVEYRAPVVRQLFTCAAAGLSRVSMHVVPEPCCDGRLRCAQFLSTGGVLRSLRDPRT